MSVLSVDVKPLH